MSCMCEYEALLFVKYAPDALIQTFSWLAKPRGLQPKPFEELFIETACGSDVC